LLVLEREDEALVVQSETEGPVLPRRADADPRAVLGVVLDKGVAKPAPAKSDARHERIRANDQPRPMTEAELIAEFGPKE
jgi:hypothetical protein